MKFLERAEAPHDKPKYKTNKASEDEGQENAATPYFLRPKKPCTEANRSLATTRPAAEGETSGKRGRTRTVNESTTSRDAAQSGYSLSGRPELQVDATVPAKASSSYFNWSKSGKQSSIAASFPKAPESIQ